MPEAMRSLMDHYSGPYAHRIRTMAANLLKGLPKHFDDAGYGFDSDEPLSNFGPTKPIGSPAR